jgi:alkylation response protein AidB-like acyl-CoA dehydrogenase
LLKTHREGQAMSALSLVSPSARPASGGEGFDERLAAALAFCREHAEAADREGTCPEAELAMLAAAGVLAAPLPERGGGRGLGTEAGRSGLLLDLLEQVGAASLPVARLLEGHINALHLIHLFGSAEQQQRYAREVRERRLRFAVWNTDAEDGLALEPDGDGYCLSGAKTLAPGAGSIERPLVTARLPDGRSQMCVVEADTAACVIDRDGWQVSGMRASASYRIAFDGVRIAPGALIGGPGDHHRQPWFTGGAVRFAAAQFGAASALFEHCRAHLRRTQRGGDAHQKGRLGEMAIALETGSLWLARAAAFLDLSLSPSADAASARIVTQANMTRSVVERVCLEVLELVERSIGLKGFLRPHPVERIGRDLRICLRQPAPDAALVEAGRFAFEQGRLGSAAR